MSRASTRPHEQRTFTQPGAAVAAEFSASTVPATPEPEPALMAEMTEKQREKALVEADKAEQQRFADWKAQWEDEGYEVAGDSMANARVTNLEDGPAFNDKPGS